MRHSQRGITFIGWLFLLLPLALCVYAVIRLTPIYLNYMNVSKAISQIVSESRGGDTTNAQALHVSIEKRFDIEGIQHPTAQDIDVHREGDHWVLIADYEEVVPMVANVSLLVQFHKRVEVP